MKKTNVPLSIQQVLVGLYLIFMLGGFPFYFQRNYIDLVSAKKNYFQIASLVFLVLLAIFCIISHWKSSTPYNIFPFSITDFCVLAFGIIIIISCCISPMGKEAFLGKEGRQMGGFFYLLCLGVYFAVSRYYKTNTWIPWLLLFSSAMLWLLVSCNFWEWDLLGMHRHLSKTQQVNFIGTLGNVNINASYSGVVVSFLLGFYYFSEKKLSKWCFFMASTLGIYACYCTASDSWLLSVGSTLLLLLIFSMGISSNMSKWQQCCISFFCGSLAMRATIVFADIINWKNIYILNFQKQKLLLFLTSPWTLLAEILIFGILYAVIHSFCLSFLKKYGNKILMGLLILGILLVGSIIFPIEDSFGTNRGYIWKRTILNFREFPIWQKLFGYGPNCFLQSMEKNFGAEMLERYTIPFLDAHNEFLQFLTITGILGAVSYMGIQCSLLVSCLHRKKQEDMFVIGVIGITAYFIQGLVNNPSIFTTPLFFIFLGILEQKCRQNRYGI